MRKIHFNLKMGKVTCVALLMSVCIFVLGQTPVSKQLKRNFASSDIFQSAVFLENRRTVENHTDENILYYAAHDNINAFFSETGVFYKVRTIDSATLNERKASATHEEGGPKVEEERGVPVVESVIKMKWLDCNPHPTVLVYLDNHSEKLLKGSVTLIR